MSHRILLIMICWLMPALPTQIRSGEAQETPSTPTSNDSAMLTHLASAVEALRVMITPESFVLPDTKVRDIVLAYLRKSEANPPKNMPTPKDLTAELNLDFETAWNGLIEKAATGLDSSGKLTLVEHFREYLRTRPQFRSQAESRRAEFDVAKTLDRVKGQIVEEQKSTLTEFLKSVVSDTTPGQELVSNVQAGGDKKKVVDTAAKEVFQRLPDETRQTMLVESFDTLSAAVDNVISDGVDQLAKQRDALKETPAAVSLPGIAKELTRRLDRMAAEQKAQRMEDRLRPTYGVFAVVQQQLPQATRQWFDRRVSEDVSNMPAQLQQIRANDALSIRTLILKNPPAHHRLSASREAVRSTIQEMIDRDLQNVLDALVDSFRQSKSADDKEYTGENFRQDVVKVVDANDTLTHKVWTELSTAQQRQLEGQILSDVRAKIRDEQAAQFAPSLVDKSWIPTEQDLARLPLNPDKLEQLSVWQDGGPPRPKESVLEETWASWQDAAEEALKVTQAALNGQLKIVDDKRDAFHQRIREEPTRTPGQWFALYCEEVITQWRSEHRSATIQYPDLFQQTKDKIKANIAVLLPQVEKELADEQMKEIPKPSPRPADLVPPKTEPPQQPQPAPGDNAAQPQNDKMKDSAASGEPGGGGGGSGSGDKKELEPEKKVEEAGKVPSDEEAKDESKEGEGDGDGKGEGEEEKKEEGDTKGDKKGEGEKVKLVEAVPVAIPVIQRTLADLFYRIGFWILLCLVLLMSICWYWNVRYLRRLLAHHEPSRPVHVTS